MKKVSLFVLFAFVLGLAWYFFVKPEDYIVRFEAPTTVGTLNQALKSWHYTKENATLIPQERLDLVVQEFKFGDSLQTYTWKLKSLTDSTSQVVLGVKDNAHSFSNKLGAITGNTPIKQMAEATARDFFNGLQDHLDSFDLQVDGESVIPPAYVAYITISGTQLQKAGGMMKYYSYLNGLMSRDDMEPKGPPFIEVTRWNQKTDSITYDFCFPIKNKKNLPQFPEVKYKRVFERKALKATYHGNYIASDRAWYRLLAFAKANNISVDPLPVEVFYNNPSYGGNEKDWKAEIFIPIKE